MFLILFLIQKIKNIIYKFIFNYFQEFVFVLKKKIQKLICNNSKFK